MRKLTDTQRRAVELIKMRGYLQKYKDSRDWFVPLVHGGGVISGSTIYALRKLGLVKIDGNTATLAEQEPKKFRYAGVRTTTNMITDGNFESGATGWPKANEGAEKDG